MVRQETAITSLLTQLIRTTTNFIAFAIGASMQRRPLQRQTFVLEPILTPGAGFDETPALFFSESIPHPMPNSAFPDLLDEADRCEGDVIPPELSPNLAGYYEPDWEPLDFVMPSYDSGVFTVGESGLVSVDFLFDGGSYQGELAIFSLSDLDFEPGSEDFIREAARRALSESVLGHVMIHDRTEGAWVQTALPQEGGNLNSGAYESIHTVNMAKGDRFGFMLIPNGTVQDVFDNPSAEGDLRPLFSMGTANPNDGETLADVRGDGTIFAMEDLRTDGNSDLDYNDVVFRVNGATATAADLDDVINPDLDWRDTEAGREILAAPAIADPVVPILPIDPITGAEYRPGELLVRFEPGTTAAEIQAIAQTYHAINIENLTSDPDPTAPQWQLLSFAENTDVLQVREAIAKDSGVAGFELNYAVSISTADPQYAQLWAMNNTGQTGGRVDADIDAQEAWQTQTGSRSVVVAVVDTGIDYRHPDLAPNIWRNSGEVAGDGVDNDRNGFVDDVYGYDFINNDGDPMDDHGHGTHVSGTIGAVGNNNIGVVGVNHAVSLMGLKFLGANNSGWAADAMRAVNYAVRMGADVINASFGGEGYSQAMMDSLNRANNAGVLFVAAAGNSRSNNDVVPAYPTNYDAPNVISVAATDHADRLASFSNYGRTTVDLGAPGVGIISTLPGNRYGSFNGTSMAAPHVAGAAALLLAQNSSLTPTQLKDILMRSTDSVASLQNLTVTGGRLNVNRALQSIATPSLPAIAPRQTITSNLSLTDPNNPLRSGRFSDDYRLVGAVPGQEIQVNLDAPFDAYLQVVNGTTGALIAEDDDSGNGTNSHLVFTVQPGTDYRLRVTSYASGATGAYTLRTMPAPPTLAFGQRLSGTLSSTDSSNPTRSGTFADDYRLTGTTAGQQVRLNLDASNFDSYVQLVNANTGQVIDFNDDANGTYNAQLTFTVQSDINYLARVTSYRAGATGSYTLSALSPTVATPSLPVIGLNQFLLDNLSAQDGNNPTRSGSFRDDYRLVGFNPGQAVQVNLESANFDTYLQLVNRATGQVLAFNDDANNMLNSQLNFTAQSGVDYLLRATSYRGGEIGNYRLSTRA